MSVFRTGGGGSITGVIKSITFDTKEWEAKKKGGEDYYTVSAQLEILVDGVKEAVKRFIPAGFFYPDTMSINDAGQIDSEKGNPLQSGTDFEKFVVSAVEKGFDLSGVEGSEGRDFSSFAGLRCKLVNIVDVEATKQFGKRKGKGDNKGKEFNRTYLAVEEILGHEAVKAGKTTKAAKPAAGKAAAKSAPAADASDDFDVNQSAKDMLYEVLGEAKDNKIVKGTLNSLTMKYAGEKGWTNPQRDEVRKLVTSDAFLKEADGWNYDGKVVSL